MNSKPLPFRSIPSYLALTLNSYLGTVFKLPKFGESNESLLKAISLCFSTSIPQESSNGLEDCHECKISCFVFFYFVCFAVVCLIVNQEANQNRLCYILSLFLIKFKHNYLKINGKFLRLLFQLRACIAANDLSCKVHKFKL